MPAPARTRILTWMCVLIAVNQLGFGSIVPALALYARSFGVPQSAIGLAIAVYGLARFLIAVPAGRLADGLGRRNTLAIGGLVSAVGNVLCALAPTYPAFVGARFLCLLAGKRLREKSRRLDVDALPTDVREGDDRDPGGGLPISLAARQRAGEADNGRRSVSRGKGEIARRHAALLLGARVRRSTPPRSRDCGS